jgi:hypothetical protein
MTHSYQYVATLPHTKRKLNAAFVHRLKKLCGKVFHYRVIEIFADEERGDYVSVRVDRQDAKDCVLALCAAYGIGSDYIEVYEDIENPQLEYIDIYLSRKKLSLDD